MRNFRKHFEISAPFHLARSLLLQMKARVKIIRKSKKYLGLCAYIHFLASIRLPKTSRIIFDDDGFLVLGTDTSAFKGWAGRTKLHMEKNAKFCINNEVWIGRESLVWVLEGGELNISGPGTFTSGKNMIICKENINIGKNVQIAWGVTICDHDFHKIYNKDGSQRPETIPIEISDNVWIGMNALILKGVKIGKNSIIAANSVVTKDVPENTLVAGNPAKIIRSDIDFRG